MRCEGTSEEEDDNDLVVCERSPSTVNEKVEVCKSQSGSSGLHYASSGVLIADLRTTVFKEQLRGNDRRKGCTDCKGHSVHHSLFCFVY